MLPGLAVDECLERREQQETDDGRTAGKDRTGGRADQVCRLGQEIGQGRGDEHAGGQGHEWVEAVAEPNGGGTAEQGGKEGQNREGNQHAAPNLIRHARV
ncbi:MAG: hypothetical protein LC797_17720 [Chloroflexi bacterium]|nr:hypothetical protein [Chloroflexota bacterium]